MMKKALCSAAFTLILIACSLPAFAQKVGYVNSASIISELPDVKAADLTVEALQKQLQKKAQEMVEKFQADYADVQRKVENGDLSPKQQEEEGKRLEAKQAELSQLEQDSYKQIQDKRNELLRPIYDRVNQAIKEVALESGYLMIVDQAVLLYSDPSADATALVRKKLGLQ
jgi:outer membrane protein